MEYIVTWTLELDAESPEDAALQALEIQRDKHSGATFFVVRRSGHPGNQEIDASQL